MTADEKIIEVIRAKYPGVNPFEKLRAICQGAFRSGDGYVFLCLLNEAIPPMMPSIVEGQNDPAAIGLREGRREISAMLYRLSGRNPDNHEDTQTHAPQTPKPARRRRGNA